MCGQQESEQFNGELKFLKNVCWKLGVTALNWLKIEMYNCKR